MNDDKKLIRRKFSNHFTLLLQNYHLDSKRILVVYDSILLLSSLAFAIMVWLEGIFQKKSAIELIKMNPIVGISMIVAFSNFILGYYVWVHKNIFLDSKQNYRFFMIWQSLSQLVLGNFVCTVLSFIGIYQAKTIAVEKSHRLQLLPLITALTILYLICFIMLITIAFKKL